MTRRKLNGAFYIAGDTNLRTAITGLERRTRPTMRTICTSLPVLSFRRITAIVVSVVPYEVIRDYYRCEDCSGCPYASECKNTDKNRTVWVSHRLNELKRKVNENLSFEKGLELRS